MGCMKLAKAKKHENPEELHAELEVHLGALAKEAQDLPGQQLIEQKETTPTTAPAIRASR